jgi:hypothetical protein
MINLYKEVLDRIKTDISIYVSFGPSKITYMGKAENIEKVQKAIKEVSEKSMEKVSIPKVDQMHKLDD